MTNYFNGTGAAHTSSRQDYETPQAIFDELNQRYGFTIDAAASPENAKLDRYWTEEDDALTKSWSGERVFVNPPYNRSSRLWLRKIGEEAEGGTFIVALLAARTDVAAFHDFLYKRPNIRIEFIRGRLRYELGGVPQPAAPFPSMLVFCNTDEVTDD